MVNVKTFLSLQMPKLVNGPMSNNQLKLPDDDDRILCNTFYIIKLQQGASYISKKVTMGDDKYNQENRYCYGNP